MEPFGCAIAIVLEVKGVVSGLSVVYLLVASQSLTPLSCAYNFITLISVLQNTFSLSSLSIGSGGTKLSLKCNREHVAYLHSML